LPGLGPYLGEAFGFQGIGKLPGGELFADENAAILSDGSKAEDTSLWPKANLPDSHPAVKFEPPIGDGKGYIGKVGVVLRKNDGQQLPETASQADIRQEGERADAVL
jgi:hypothetical protein